MQKTTTFLMFVGEQAGKAEEAINFYISLFENAAVLNFEHYGPGEGKPEGSVKQEVRLVADRFGVSWRLNLPRKG